MNMTMLGMKGKCSGLDIDIGRQRRILVNPLKHNLRTVAQIRSANEVHRSQSDIGSCLTKIKRVTDDEPVTEAMLDVHGKVRDQTCLLYTSDAADERSSVYL